jgi:hypothetical protein
MLNAVASFYMSDGTVISSNVGLSAYGGTISIPVGTATIVLSGTIGQSDNGSNHDDNVTITLPVITNSDMYVQAGNGWIQNNLGSGAQLNYYNAAGEIIFTSEIQEWDTIYYISGINSWQLNGNGHSAGGYVTNLDAGVTVNG